jgi:hypothetical protein
MRRFGSAWIHLRTYNRIRDSIIELFNSDFSNHHIGCFLVNRAPAKLCNDPLLRFIEEIIRPRPALAHDDNSGPCAMSGLASGVELGVFP